MTLTQLAYQSAPLETPQQLEDETTNSGTTWVIERAVDEIITAASKPNKNSTILEDLCGYYIRIILDTKPRYDVAARIATLKDKNNYTAIANDILKYCNNGDCSIFGGLNNRARKTGYSLDDRIEYIRTRLGMLLSNIEAYTRSESLIETAELYPLDQQIGSEYPPV